MSEKQSPTSAVSSTSLTLADQVERDILDRLRSGKYAGSITANNAEAINMIGERAMVRHNAASVMTMKHYRSMMAKGIEFAIKQITPRGRARPPLGFYSPDVIDFQIIDPIPHWRLRPLPSVASEETLRRMRSLSALYHGVDIIFPSAPVVRNAGLDNFIDLLTKSDQPVGEHFTVLRGKQRQERDLSFMLKPFPVSERLEKDPQYWSKAYDEAEKQKKKEE